MLKSGVIVAAIVWVALAAGGIVFVAESRAGWGSFGLQGVQSRDSAQRPRPAKPSAGEEVLGNSLDVLRKAFGANLEFLLYGAIAGFGILMVGLAIGSASSSRSKTDAQLELLKQEKEKAENLAKLKSEFLNQVSHELRTPLAVIIGYVECMTDGLYGQLDAKHQEILQTVANQSSHLKNMIDQILIYSRLEAGKQPIRVEEVNLTKILADLKETFEFLCRQKGLQLRWQMHSEAILVRSDVTRLKEVISNLLQNAVKYTDAGSITMRTSQLSGNSIMIEVEDSGIGISETHLASIFEPFMQVHKTSTENSRGGIGLGLSIVKKHLEQVGGKISVKSELGKGSTFRVVLPRQFDRQKSPARWLFNWVKLRAQRGVYSILAIDKEARSQKTDNPSRAIG
jgi:signal transduction histidine kinase